MPKCLPAFAREPPPARARTCRGAWRIYRARQQAAHPQRRHCHQMGIPLTHVPPLFRYVCWTSRHLQSREEPFSRVCGELTCLLRQCLADSLDQRFLLKSRLTHRVILPDWLNVTSVLNVKLAQRIVCSLSHWEGWGEGNGHNEFHFQGWLLCLAR